jgi:hypothetical protein
MSDAGRTETAAKAVAETLAPFGREPGRIHEGSIGWGATPHDLARSVLAAADGWDRDHGIVRVDTRDQATVMRLAYLIEQMPASASDTIAQTLLDDLATPVGAPQGEATDA